ncbi:bifunctional nuclease family protein [Candidatus Bathyarchaeota archaeon]|nr:bifunctional nuclease family protein [Candidatus Bathyarchaeota archaeon]
MVLAFSIIAVVGTVSGPDYRAELRGVVISPDVALVILETHAGNLSMVLSPEQGVAIRDALNYTEHYRPTTHDLATELAGKAGVRKLVVYDLVNGTYMAELHLRTGTVDTRPSDGMVVCAIQDCPIYVARHLVGKTT